MFEVFYVNRMFVSQFLIADGRKHVRFHDFITRGLCLFVKDMDVQDNDSDINTYDEMVKF